MSAILKSIAKYGWPFALVLVLWYVSLRVVPCLYGAPDGSAAFGDMFGAINALFTGLAFAGLIVTLFVQQKAMQRQQFEAVLFQMLSMHNDIVGDIVVQVVDPHKPWKFVEPIEVPLKKCRGRDVFPALLDDFVRTLGSTKEIPEDKLGAYIATKWEQWFNKYHGSLGHYFRLLYRLVDFVDSGKISIDDKRFYVATIRAQTSDHEQALLVYNCIGQYGFKRFRKLVVQYELDEHAEIALGDLSEHRRILRDPKSFGLFNND